jgi:ribosomal protein S18 acetylase RimI-like enzyme
MLCPSRTAGSPTPGGQARIGEIQSLSVLPDYRSSGLGSLLLVQLETHLRTRGAKDLILGVLPGNADAMTRQPAAG